MNETNLLNLPRTWRLRTWVGLLIFLTGGLVVGTQLWTAVRSNAAVWNALLGGSAAVLATALGTLPVLFSHRFTARFQDSLLGFGAGIMLAASIFSLMLPSFEAARHSSLAGGTWSAASVVLTAVVLGALALFKLDRILPHEHTLPAQGAPDARQLRRTWLFVIAIAFHNLPEGLAIGVGYAGTETMRANALTMGIAIQDVPEGLIIASALLAAGYRRSVAVTLGRASGLVEPLGAVVGASVVGHSAALLPWGLGFAAGAMLFVIFHEFLPELRGKKHQNHGYVGLAAGFLLMTILDAYLA